MEHMEVQFDFVEKNGGACVTKILSPGAVCVIPETLSGLPVTELGEKVFAQTGVEEVFLPKTLRRLGRYCFYGCENLSHIHFYGGPLETGGGFLAACGRLRELTVHMDPSERSALRDFVTEANGRLLVHYLLPGPDGEEHEAARLLFPVYYDEAVENTPARITVSNIHGTGQKYRYCFEDKRVRFDKYDRLFVYETAEESVTAAAEIAVSRLMYPHGLWAEARSAYGDFLKEHRMEVFLDSLGKMEVFKWLMAHGPDGEPGSLADGLTREETETLLLEASRRKMGEISGMLMEFKYHKFPEKKKKFEF